MNEFNGMILRQRKGMLFLLALVVLGVVFLHSRVLNGLLLGGLISFYNLWLLQRKIIALDETTAESGRPRRGLGTLSRMAAAVLAAAIAMRYEETFHIIAVVIGLMLSYLVIFFDGIYDNFIRKNQDS